MSTCQSSILRKMLMGGCGLVWVGFVLTHMAANLLIPFSAEAYNRYSHALTSNKLVLYGAESILVLSILIHAFLGIKLYLENRKANAGKYAVPARTAKKATLASKTMAYQGSLILFFIIFHIWSFKYGNYKSGPYYTTSYADGVVMRDLHRMIIEAFSSPIYTFGYLFCLLILGWHLSHGVSSVFQSLGLNHPKYTPMIKTSGYIYSAIVAGGFMIVPIYVFFLV